MRRLAMLRAAALVMVILWAAPVDAQTGVTGAGAGIFPAGTSFNGVPLNALKLGMGVSVAGSLTEGQFQTTLIGVSLLGLEQDIQVEGKASSGASSSNSAIFSGTCTVEMGDGTPPVSGVPFTVVVATNADGTGSLTLTLGATNLPAATVNEGYMTIK